MKTGATILALGLIGTTIGNDSIEVVGVLTEESSEFGVFRGSGNSSNNWLTMAPPLGSFTYDFSALGDTDVCFTWTAPSGYFIEIDVPENFDDYEIEFLYRAGNIGSNSEARFFGSDVLLDIEYLPGSDVMLLANEQIVFTGEIGDSVRAAVDTDKPVGGELFQLTALTLKATVPDSYDKVLDSNVVEFQISGRASLDGGRGEDEPGDPGQWIRLVADCNNNGVRDTHDIADGTVYDCNCNGLIDDCEISEDPSLDLDNSGVVDSCEEDFCPDIDCDGIVTFLDLWQVIFNFGQTGQNAADVNFDGVVNFWDYIIVAYSQYQFCDW